MRVRTFFQNTRRLEPYLEDAPSPSKSAHPIKRAYIKLLGQAKGRRLLFLKQSDAPVEHDIEIALSAMNQLDGPYFSKTIGFAVYAENKKEARSMVGSVGFQQFCSYKSLSESDNHVGQSFIEFSSNGMPKKIKNVKGLASLLLAAYRDGEDDLHRQNFGGFKNEKGDWVWGRIDFGLGYSETTQLAPRPFRSNGFSQNAFSLITLKDIAEFPNLTDASLFYWPTLVDNTNSRFNPNSGNRYRYSDKMLFSQLANDANFLEEKHQFLLKQFITPISLKQEVIRANISDGEIAEKLADAVSYRGHALMITALADKDFRCYFRKKVQAFQKEHGLQNDLVHELIMDANTAYAELCVESGQPIDPQIYSGRTVARRLNSFLAIAKKMDDDSNKACVNRIEFQNKASAILLKNSSDAAQDAAFNELVGDYLQDLSAKNKQAMLDDVHAVKANFIIMQRYKNLLNRISQFKNEDGIAEIFNGLSQLEKTLIDLPITKSLEERPHEVNLLDNKKSHLIRKFCSSMALLINLLEEENGEQERQEIAKTIKKLAKYLESPADDAAKALEDMQKKMMFLPYELKIIKMQAKMAKSNAYLSNVSFQHIQKLIQLENGQKGLITKKFMRHLNAGISRDSAKGSFDALKNSKISESYLNILETCDAFLSSNLEADIGAIKDKTSLANLMKSAHKIKRRLFVAAQMPTENAIYEVDCLIARLALQVEICRAEQMMINHQLPAGLTAAQYNGLIQAARQVVLAVAKPKYHENESLVEVAKATRLVAMCLKNPNIENALYCQNHVGKLCLSKKTRALTRLMAAVSVFCLMLSASCLVAAGVAGLSSGIGFVGGIVALSAGIKLFSIAFGGLGLAVGGYATYRFVRDEDLMKRKVGFFAERAVSCTEDKRYFPENKKDGDVEMITMQTS